jgi:hypothetical protein
VKERLVRVTSEAEIRVGAIYVVKACRRCGRNERFIAISRDPRMAYSVDDPGVTGSGWHISPRPWCWPEGVVTWMPITNLSQGRLFRVEDPNLDLNEENPYLAKAPAETLKSALKTRGWL